MNEKKFKDKFLETLVEDKDVAKYFAKANSDTEKQILKDHLEDSLEEAYNIYAKDYYNTKGFGNYLSGGLRVLGGVGDAVGTYAFWALGGAGFGIKGLGIGAKSLADVIDHAHYETHTKAMNEKLDLKEKIFDRLELAGESFVTRAAAYLPLGVGEITDLVRGFNKYDSKINDRTIYLAKDNFLKRIGAYQKKEGLKTVPLKHFANPAYAGI